MRILLSLLSILTSFGALPANIQHGEYLSYLSDCSACHTADPDKPFAGGRAFFTPMGTLYSTNITPDKITGIGNYSLQDFEQAVRHGVAKNQQRLYPAMPYKQYSQLSDSDITDLYAYFMQRVKPITLQNPSNKLNWPFSIRWPMIVWNWLTPAPIPWSSAAGANSNIARGAFLVTGPGHCGACHTPRGLLMQEVSMDPKDPKFLSGSPIDQWYAPSLRNLPYSAEELVQLLKYGHNTTSAINGPMTDVVSNSTQYFTLTDLNAMAAFLYSIQLPHSALQPSLPLIMQSAARLEAEADYNRHCAVCHGKSGEGIKGVIPSLQRNLIVDVTNPASYINVVLHGASTPLTQAVMSWAMPSFEKRLSPQKMANMLTWIRSLSPASAGEVTVQQIKQQQQQRRKTSPNPAH